MSNGDFSLHQPRTLRRNEAFKAVIKEVRKKPGRPSDITDRLKKRMPYRTVVACLKRGIDLEIFKKIQGGRYAWDSYDERSERIKEIVEDLKPELLRYPTIKEIAVKIGMSPGSMELTSRLYAVAAEVDWREPTDEEVERTVGKTRLEVIVELLKLNPDSDWLKNYCKEEEIEEASKLLLLFTPSG